jgi:hypothetical protein
MKVAIGSAQRQLEAVRPQSEAIGGGQTAIIGNWRRSDRNHSQLEAVRPQSEAIIGNQRQLEAIGGNWRRSNRNHRQLEALRPQSEASQRAIRVHQRAIRVHQRSSESIRVHQSHPIRG